MISRKRPAAASRGGHEILRPSSGHSSGHSSRPSRGLAFVDVVAAVETMWQVASERRRLRRLDDAALRDIGISRTDAEREASRPFWDVAARLRREE